MRNVTRVLVLSGVLFVLILVVFAAGCGLVPDQAKQEAQKKVEAKAQQAKKEAKKRVEAKKQQAKNEAKKEATHLQKQVNAKKQEVKKEVEAGQKELKKKVDDLK